MSKFFTKIRNTRHLPVITVSIALLIMSYLGARYNAFQSAASVWDRSWTLDDHSRQLVADAFRKYGIDISTQVRPPRPTFFSVDMTIQDYLLTLAVAVFMFSSYAIVGAIVSHFSIKQQAYREMFRQYYNAFADASNICTCGATKAVNERIATERGYDMHTSKNDKPGHAEA